MDPGTNLDEQLLSAAKQGDVAAVRQALSAGANVDAQDGSGRTALMEASMRSEVDIMRALIDAGANVNLTAALGETALILAASARAVDTVPILLEHHADPKIADRDKKTVLMWLVDLQFHRGGVPVDVIGPLVAAGADPNAQDKFGRTPLMWAVKGDLSSHVPPAVLTALIQHGADVNRHDTNGETALHGLVRYIDDTLDLDGGRECLDVLLGAGADRKAKNNDGKTAFGVVRPNNKPVIDLLKKVGLDT